MDIAPVLDKMREAVDLPAAQQLLDAFYDTDRPFSGVTYLELGDNSADSIGLDDILAVSLLDTALSPLAVRRLLTDCPAEVTHFLTVSNGRVLGNSEPFVPGDTTYDAALAAWQTLVRRQFPGVGPVRASKLMARKRPQLIPVVDSRIEWVLGLTGEHNSWQVFDEAMRDKGLVDRLAKFRVPQLVPTLRVLDTLLWMLASRSRNAQTARVHAGLPQEAWMAAGPP